MAGLDGVAPGEEFAWAVRVALAPVDEMGESLFGESADGFVESTYEFIAKSFAKRGLKPPDRTQLVEAVRAEQHERALDWIYDDFLEGGRLDTGAALTEDQWQAIEEMIRSAHVEPPPRSAVDAMIAQRQRG